MPLSGVRGRRIELQPLSNHQSCLRFFSCKYHKHHQDLSSKEKIFLRRGEKEKTIRTKSVEYPRGRYLTGCVITSAQALWYAFIYFVTKLFSLTGLHAQMIADNFGVQTSTDILGGINLRLIGLGNSLHQR